MLNNWVLILVWLFVQMLVEIVSCECCDSFFGIGLFVMGQEGGYIGVLVLFQCIKPKKKIMSVCGYICVMYNVGFNFNKCNKFFILTHKTNGIEYTISLCIKIKIQIMSFEKCLSPNGIAINKCSRKWWNKNKRIYDRQRAQVYWLKFQTNLVFFSAQEKN